MKQFRCLSWCLFYLAGASWQTEYVRACPGCMRRHLAWRTLVNLVPANVLWPVMVLPWAAVQFVSTYQKGHSPTVLSGRLPEQFVVQPALGGPNAECAVTHDRPERRIGLCTGRPIT